MNLREVREMSEELKVGERVLFDGKEARFHMYTNDGKHAVLDECSDGLIHVVALTRIQPAPRTSQPETMADATFTTQPKRKDGAK